MSPPADSQEKATQRSKSPNSLEEFVNGVPDVQLLSGTGIQLLRDLNKEDLSGRQIADKVSQDPTLSARILQLANSSYFGTLQRIATVNQAVTMLGVENVRKLIQGLYLMELSSPKGFVSRVLGGKAFAAHAIAVSYLSGAVTKSFGFQVLGRGESETAGLLHDIGLCFLGQSDLGPYKDLQDRFWRELGEYLKAEERPPLVDFERETLGFTHAELGGWLAARWNLPFNIQEALTWHHGPVRNCVSKEIVASVHVAEVLANRNHLDFLPVGTFSCIHPEIAEFLDSQGKEGNLDRIESGMKEDVEKAGDLYQVLSSEGQRVPEESPSAVTSRSSSTVAVGPKLQAVRKTPPWAYLLAGLPQIARGETAKGIGYLSFFTVSFLLFLFVAISGASSILSVAFLAVSAASWVLSILQG